MSAAQDLQLVTDHYGRHGLGAIIFNGLRAAGKDIDSLTHADLAPVDQFHTGGRKATLELARLADIRADEHVVDVGGGVGGPARTLAAEFGCHVTVIDITEEFCRVGELLTARTGLSGSVAFETGSALDMPFPDSGFDVAWTQHSTMNIAAKEQLYGEIYRVLRPGGRLAMHEIMAGSLQPIHFPAHWASTPALSFLLPSQIMRDLITRAGFRERVWVDQSVPALEGFRKGLEAVNAASSPPPLGLHLLMGETFKPALVNMVRNLEEGRIATIKAVYEKP